MRYETKPARRLAQAIFDEIESGAVLPYSFFRPNIQKRAMRNALDSEKKKRKLDVGFSFTDSEIYVFASKPPYSNRPRRQP